MIDVLSGPDFLLAGAPQRHAGYVQLRDRGSVHQIGLRSGETAWLITGYEAVRDALIDTRMEPRTATVGRRRRLSQDVLSGMNNHMLNCNPPDHTRLRRLVSAAFTRRRMKRMRPRIQQITDGLLDAIVDAEEVDLLKALALPLPLVALSDLIGVPEEDTSLFHGWTSSITSNSVGIEDLDDAAANMLQYIRSLIESKRRAPAHDLLTALVAVRDGEDRLTEDELSSMVFLLLTAGHETTINLIGNAVLSLLSHPRQLALLQAKPELLPGAVEETLRFESPVQVSLRTTLVPITVEQVAIPAGATVILSLLAANRDPARFAAPDEFRIDRAENPQLAFGYGFHHCIGATLARLEATVALGSLLTRFPKVRLAAPADTLDWRVSMIMHGLEGLPVRLR